jgi:hypothetical protein
MGSMSNVSDWAEIEGHGLRAASVGRPAGFDITARGLTVDDVQARVTSPTGEAVSVRVVPETPDKLRCEYTTPTVGTYSLELSLRGRPVPHSPFRVHAFAPHLVVIEPQPGGAVGKPVQFTGRAA